MDNSLEKFKEQAVLKFSGDFHELVCKQGLSRARQKPVKDAGDELVTMSRVRQITLKK